MQQSEGATPLSRKCWLLGTYLLVAPALPTCLRPRPLDRPGPDVTVQAFLASILRAHWAFTFLQGCFLKEPFLCSGGSRRKASLKD